MSDNQKKVEMESGKSSGSTSAENEIARLMKEYDLSRQEAESVLKRDSTDRRGHSMISVSKEEFDNIMEEIARSGEIMTLGNFSKKEALDDEEQQET